MDFHRLNPYIRSCLLYEKKLGGDFRRGYDAAAYYVLSGGVTLDAEGEKRRRLSPGAFFLIPSGLSYKIKSDGARLLVIRFDFYAADGADCPTPALADAFDPSRVRAEQNVAPFDRLFVVEDMADLRDTFLDMSTVYLSASGEYRARLSATFKSILIRAAELADEDALPYQMTEALDAYIRENVGEDLSNTEIGAVFGYHPFYVSQMLKKKRGITLRQYIISYRLKMAKNLLTLTDKSIGEIAEECAFTDSSYFTKAFKAEFGIAPKAYRNEIADELI